MNSLFNKIWRNADIPEAWTHIMVTMLPKGGDNSDPNNYRPIALVNAIVKIFTQIIHERLYSWCEDNRLLPEFQSGFRRGRSCQDNIFVLSTIIENRIRRPKAKVYTLFVDFKRAFPSVNHDLLFQKLHSLGISDKFVHFLYKLYTNAKMAVKKEHSKTSLMDISEGLLQGEVLSSTLFALFIADLEKYLREKGIRGITIQKNIDILLLVYADDISITLETLAMLKRTLAALESYCAINKLTVNVKKTNIIIFKKGRALRFVQRIIFFYNQRLFKLFDFSLFNFLNAQVILYTSARYSMRVHTHTSARCGDYAMMKKEQADNWEPHDEASVSDVSGLHVETFENPSDCIHSGATTDETIYNQESVVTRSIINQINNDEPPTRDVDSDDEHLPFEERYSDEFNFMKENRTRITAIKCIQFTENSRPSELGMRLLYVRAAPHSSRSLCGVTKAPYALLCARERGRLRDRSVGGQTRCSLACDGEISGGDRFSPLTSTRFTRVTTRLIERASIFVLSAVPLSLVTLQYICVLFLSLEKIN
ncbi:unnamed protein product [Trichogramma brassicae]|uniref:Reverse transcriptase domain-containing protein n=1 Tax=Trichogramma brassicae TaxID=86971 RepID=A0A6H5IEM9_9HYME|nr:unnamed protein product [Trichogramma brassicae]